MSQFPILHLDHLTHQFPKTRVPAVDQVSFTLHQGDMLALLGPSGCGKTTLLRLIAGFERPQAGTITLAERVVAGAGQWLPPEHRDVGMVFQDYALFPHLTVAENVAFGLRRRGHQQQVEQQVKEVLSLVGLTDLPQRYPHELSGGQQQRVALARALAPRPALVLLDEPLSNLDVQVRLQLRRDVRDILKATGATAIFVTHDQEEAMAIADQVAVMHQGWIEQQGSPERLYQDPMSRFVAEFVTQANFLPARRRGEFWETELGRFAIAPFHCTCEADWDICQREPSHGELMIRQESLVLEPDPEGILLVRDRQFLGREYCYHLELPSGRQIQARTLTHILLPVGSRARATALHQALRFYPHRDSDSSRSTLLEREDLRITGKFAEGVR
jgi:iron(III) transport system ATP-binding protein